MKTTNCTIAQLHNAQDILPYNLLRFPIILRIICKFEEFFVSLQLII